MNSTAYEIAAALLCVACVFAVICRVNQLSRDSLKRVRLQFVLLGAGCMAGLLTPLMPQGLGRALLALSVLVFLILGAKRWRHGAPKGTCTAPAPLGDAELKHVPGGKR